MRGSGGGKGAGRFLNPPVRGKPSAQGSRFYVCSVTLDRPLIALNLSLLIQEWEIMMIPGSGVLGSPTCQVRQYFGDCKAQLLVMLKPAFVECLPLYWGSPEKQSL